MNTITWLVAVLAVVLVIRIFVVGYPDDSLTRAQRHYIEVLDDSLYHAGYIAGMSSRQSSSAEGHVDDIESNRFDRFLGRMPRPNMTDADAAATNALVYQEGWDDGSSNPFSDADLNAHRGRLADAYCGEFFSARRAAFQ